MTSAAPHLDRIGTLLGVMILLLSIFGCSRSATDPTEETARVYVSAAASTSDVIQTIAKEFTRSTGIDVVCNVASSAALARQIQHGAPADVFLSANELWMDELQQDQLVDGSTRRNLLGNSLVIIAPVDRPFEFDPAGGRSLAEAVHGRIAIGDPEHVPSGRYARQALESLGWWDELPPRILSAVDVRAAVRYVEQGAVDAAIVYATDARASDRVVVVSTLAVDLHEPIVYPIAVTATGSETGARFLEFVCGPEAAAIFQDAGFDLLE